MSTQVHHFCPVCGARTTLGGATPRSRNTRGTWLELRWPNGAPVRANRGPSVLRVRVCSVSCAEKYDRKWGATPTAAWHFVRQEQGDG